MTADHHDEELPMARKGKVEIRPPSYALRAKAPLTGTDLATVVARANVALADLGGSYQTILEDERRLLFAAATELERTGGAAAAAARVAQMAREMRGHSGSIGFGAIFRICDSLCRFLGQGTSLPQRGVEIVRLHLDALIVVLRDGKRNEEFYAAIIDDLERVIRKFNGT